MGLDQYIYRLEGEDDRVEVACFRKVNFLHAWVEEHLNGGQEHNCDDIPMHLEAIAGLAQTCHRVLDDPQVLGPKLLPTRVGFFFGGTAYDDAYLDDVRDVLDACHCILLCEKGADPPGSGRYVYWSWW